LQKKSRPDIIPRRKKQTVRFMRILHIIPQFPYFGGRTLIGGHATCLMSLALAQHNAGEQVSILSYIEGHAGPREIEDGPTVFSLFPHAKTRTVRFGLQFCRAAIAWVRAHRNEFDVVHVHSGYADYFMVSGRLKAQVGLPTLHTVYCPIAPSGRWRLPMIHALIKHWANRLDWLGAISENTAVSMSEYGMRRVQVIRPALETGRFSYPEAGVAARKELGIREDDLVVLFVGNAKPQKNAIGALRAIHRLRTEFPNIKFLITTELKHTASDADLALLAQEIDTLQLNSCIIQKGIVDNMPALMQACDVLVAPFLNSYGPTDYFMAVLEAMASGKPVVVSDVGGMPEVVSDEVGRLVQPMDDASIAAGLRTFLADSKLRMKTGANARAFAKKNFHPPAVCAEYGEVYRRCLS
jgi:glycosyltransferase involved in cell wall biosynthesis